MMAVITSVECVDIRFPTSQGLHGSDAMHTAPDYSAAYVTIHTDANWKGYGIGFTLGRGTEVVVAAVEILKELVIGRNVEKIFNNFGAFWHELVNEDQFRWLGPEKGVVHIATAAIVNALWDIWAKMEGKPLWKLLADMDPEKLVSCIDFTYISDVLTPSEALEMLKKQRQSAGEREDFLKKYGYPAYVTSVGWLGYSDEKIQQLCKEALNDGWRSFKMKVGVSVEDDMRRGKIIRKEIGDECNLMMDANQRWSVNEAIEYMKHLSPLKPLWIEEPTSPDDVLGHAAIAKALQSSNVGVATGEACQNRVIFKQLLQSEAISFCQVDCCRVGGVNENLAIILMANKYGVPICPHAGGVGLCEMVQHLSFFDYIAVSGSLENRMIEWVGHLHDHFVHPIDVRQGRYYLPQAPGHSSQMTEETVVQYKYPDGPVWTDIRATSKLS